MKEHEFDRVVKKLDMQTRNSYDLLAWFVHNGSVVVRTRRSLGKGKYVPADKIRQQLKVNEEQMSGLISCSVTRKDYVDILTSKGLIEKPKAEETTSPQKASRPKHKPSRPRP
jgi:hypothetical protein